MFRKDFAQIQPAGDGVGTDEEEPDHWANMSLARKSGPDIPRGCSPAFKRGLAPVAVRTATI
ncbi:hypothetical protein A6U96_22880 [Agrobacterium tumefaciens]|nr:hypothetical protein A6U96_22880 [Agrobacterium tumefaciens]